MSFNPAIAILTGTRMHAHRSASSIRSFARAGCGRGSRDLNRLDANECMMTDLRPTSARAYFLASVWSDGFWNPAVYSLMCWCRRSNSDSIALALRAWASRVCW